MTERAERVIRYQFVKVRFSRGSWVNLVIERPNGKLKRVKGLLLNTPVIFLQRMDGTIETVPLSRIVKIESCLSPREARERMLKERAYRLAKEIRKRERLIARYYMFTLKRLRRRD